MSANLSDLFDKPKRAAAPLDDLFDKPQKSAAADVSDLLDKPRSAFDVLNEISGASSGEPSPAPAVQPVASHQRFGQRPALPVSSHKTLQQYAPRPRSKYTDVTNALQDDTRSEMLFDSGVQNVASRVDELGAGALRLADKMPGGGINLAARAAEMLGLAGPRALERAADWLQRRGDEGRKAVEDYQANLEKPVTTGEQLFQSAVELPGDVATTAIATEVGGPVLGFAGQSGLSSMGRGEDTKTVIKETVKGGLTGAIFKGASPIQSRVGRAATVGAGTFATEKAFGSDNSSATKAAAANAAFAALGGRPSEERNAARTPRVDNSPVLNPTSGLVDHKATALSNLKSAFEANDSPAIEDAFARARSQGASDAEIRAAIGDTKAPAHTLKENIYSALNIPRSVVTAGDLSASARQGAVLSAGHPIKAARAFKAQVEAFASEAKARETLDNLAKDKSVQEGVKSGLFMPDLMDDSLTVARREEAFGSRFTKHLPLVARSERAYNVFLNKLRGDVWKDVYESHPNMTETDKAELARTLNVLTGRGRLPGPLDKHAADVAQILFAPRLLASRIETPFLLAGNSPVARREAARNLVAFVGANLSFLGAAKLAGADVELDPRSTDFLRARAGDTRVDLAAGYQAPIRYAAQLLMAERKDVDTKEIKSASRRDVATRFGRTRLAPQLSIPLDLATGKNIAGEKVGPADAALSGIEYLSARDIAEAVAEDRRRGGSGLRGAALGSLSLFGVGVSTYHNQPASKEQIDYIQSLARRKGLTIETNNLSQAKAGQIINELKGDVQK